MADAAGGGGSATARLAEFASELRFDDIPAATIEHAKLSVLDTIGCSIFGAGLPWIEMVHRFVLAEGGAEQATLWGTPTRVSRTQAALANATAAHSFEFDDVHMGGMIHPGALTLGAALAAGEGGRLDGRELLTSIVAGCEVGARVGRAVGIAHFRAGFHPQGTVGVFAAAASAARALRVGASTAREALGLAGTQAAGLMAAQEGSMAKRLHSGLACQAGARSALLAVTGFTGIPDVLEADFGGFCSSMGGGDVHLAALTSALGERWETDAIGFKPYASCAAAQSSIEVTRQLRNELLPAGAVARSVRIHCSTHARIHCGWAYKPSGVTAAQMSIPYGVASMLVHGDVSADRFSEAAIAEPATVDLASRVEVVGDETIDALGPDHRYAVRVEIRTVDGRLITASASDRPGGPSQPMAPSDVVEKFERLVAPLIGAGGAKALRRAVERLESVEDVDVLISLMKAGGPTAAAGSALNGR